MKKARAILCGVLAALMLAGCGGQQGGATLDLKQYTVAQAVYPDYPKRPIETDYYRDDGQWDDSAYEADYEKYVDGLRALGKDDERVDTAALTAFSGNTAAAIFTTQENTVYSPVSLYVALSMLAELTDGETKRQVLDLLGVTDSGALREWTKTLWEQLYCDDGINTLRLANAAFLNETVQFRQPALDTLAESFYASSYRVPMGTTAANDTIGAWINEQTGGLLADAANGITTQADTLLKLYNTIYYKAGWMNCFLEENTSADTFTAADGTGQACDFMHRTVNGESYRRGEDYLAAQLAMNDGGCMTFVLPDEGVMPETLLKREGFLTEITERDDYAKIHWSVPRFDASSTVELEDALQALGITDAFDADRADLSPLTDDGAYVSNVTQAARVKVDEQGVEAAAYTEIGIARTALPPENLPVVEMNLNRPFLFVIRQGDVPLFIGTVQTLKA